MDSEAEYWSQEAEGVMADIKNHVKEIKISTLPITKYGVYLNVTTLEGQKFCFHLGSSGFEVVGRDYDKTDESGNEAFETPYALLRSISEKFTPAFNDSLRSKLNSVLATELENDRMRTGRMSPKQLNQVASESSKEAINRHIPPWPEWNDSEINTVEWNPNQKTKGKETKGSKKPPKSAMGSNKSAEKDLLEATQNLFDDESGLLVLPENIKEQVYSWKRPFQINTNIKYVLAAEDSPMDLLSENKHLLNYEVMSSIVCSIMCLEREAMLRPFPVEFQSDKYRANGGPIWKPWHHVYSFSKVGKGSSHRMSYNRYGKYIVRLFYMGKWRQISVDDKFPVDNRGNILLPCSNKINLWLPILSKAILKVAALTWTPELHILDFSVVHCLTGWLYTSVECRNVDVYNLWCICCQLLPTSQEISAAPECCSQLSDESVTCLKPEGPFAYDTIFTRAIFAYFPPQTPFQTTSTCVHPALIANVKYNDEEPAPRWKEYRWAEWAFNRGLISDKTLYTVRNVEVFCPFQEYLRHENFPGEHNNGNKDLKDAKEKKNWSNFDKIIKEIEYLEVFYKPSCFPYAVTAFNIADLLVPFYKQAPMSVREDGGKSKNTKRSGSKDRNTVKPSEEKKSPKMSKNTLRKPADEKKTQSLGSTYDNYKLSQVQQYPCFYLLCDTQMCKTLYIVLSVLPQLPEKDDKYFYLTIENFNWKHHAYKDSMSNVITVGTKSMIVKLPAGLQVIRVWYKLPALFCIQIYSNSPFFTGLKTQIQDQLAEDSVSFKYYGYEISKNFGTLLDAPHGGRLHGEAYTNFIHSFNPPQIQVQLKWPYWFTTEVNIQHAFEESIIELLTESLPPSVTFFKAVEAYQMLFLNHIFGEAVLEEISGNYLEVFKEGKLSKQQKEDLKEIKMKEDLGKQRGKKGKSPQANNKKNAKADGKKGQKSAPQMPMKKLIEVSVDALLLANPSNAIKILRKMMEKLPNLLSYYPFKDDDHQKLVYYDYNGESKVFNKWALLFRTSLNIHCEEAGYTLCAYVDASGHPHMREVPWRLRILGTNHDHLFHVCTLPADTTCTRTKQICNQMFTTVTGYYIPNKCNIIGRCLMRVHRDTMVMLRLKLSNDSVQCELIIQNDYTGDVIAVSRGTGEIILPVLKLEGPNEFHEVEYNMFTVIIKVVNNTWILSETEKVAALAVKVMTQAEISEMSDQKRYSAVTRRSTTSKIVSSSEQWITPSWHLTLIEDDLKDPPVTLTLDTSKTDLLKRMIIKWQEDDRDILIKGMEYRQQFLSEQNELFSIHESPSVENMFNLVPERTNRLIQQYGSPTAQSELAATTTAKSDISVKQSYTTLSQEESLDVSGSEAQTQNDANSVYTEVILDQMTEQQNLINALIKFYNDRKALLQIPLDEAYRIKNECVQQLLLEQKDAEMVKKMDKKQKAKKSLVAKDKRKKSKE